MSITIRKRSPRAPLISLREAVERASKVYEKEGKHPASADIVAQHLGYKSAENGAAKQALAALGYYGLMVRPSEGMLAVSKSFEEYKFAPTDELRAKILQKWLLTPSTFAELREKFQDRLPSDASLKFELIQKGFNPATADECRAAFVESLQYVNGLMQAAIPKLGGAEGEVVNTGNEGNEGNDSTAIEAKGELAVSEVMGRYSEPSSRMAEQQPAMAADEGGDRIPVRLTNGRRAWLVIPSPFYAADKRRLISQIELLLADDEE